MVDSYTSEWLSHQNEPILNAAGDGIFGLDLGGRATFVNPAAARMIGSGAEELIGKPVHDVLHHSKPNGAPYPREECPICAAFKDGAVHRIDNEVFWRKDGTSFPVEYTSTPIREGGNLVGAVVVFKDITERKRAEEVLQKEQQFIKAVLDNIEAGIVACDAQGILTLFNRATREFHGLPEEPLPAEEWAEHYDLYLSDGKTLMKKEDVPLFRSLQGDTVRNVEMMIIPKQGAARTLLASGQPILTPGGKKLGAVVAMHDITERKQAEGVLRKTLAQLSKKNRYEAIISTVTRSVHQSINLQEVIENAVDAMSKNMEGMEYIAIFLVEGQEAVLRAYRGYPNWYIERVRRIPYPKGFIWKTIIEGKPRYVADVDQDTVIGPAGREVGTKSYASMPIHCEGKTVGAIGVNSFQKNAFDEEELKLLEIVSQQIGVAINNAKQAEALRQSEEVLRKNLTQLSKKNRYETIISTVTRSVHQSINLQEVLDNAVGSLHQNIDKVEQAAIFFVEGEEAVLKVHRGHPDWFIKRAGRIPYPRGFTWRTIIDDKPRYIADVDEDTAIGPAGRELGIKCYLCMPIHSEDKVVGTLNINSFEKHAFDEEERKLLETVSRQIEVAINNAKQAEALREALSQVERLKNRLQAENVYLREEIKTEYNFEEIVGESKALKNVLRNVEQVAPTDTTVLIQGETGTGKELIARAIHNLSLRKDRPLVKVNCGAISAGLVESELFGHEKGAFTGALQQRVGRFELASGGTIFLDEVSELSLDTQVKLLRVLQEGEFERVGSSKTIKVNVRVIAATNRDLSEAVKTGSFRSDLFYRLNVFPLEVPPLRERNSDIPLLVNSFLSRFAKKLGKQIDGVSKDTMDRLIGYAWPGNIRELQNVIERAVVLTHGSIIHIDESMLKLGAGLHASGSKALEDMERSHILGVLEETNWVIYGKRGAASVLGLNPSTLRFRIKKLGIKRPQPVN